jgi:uncharacterized protein (TIGR02284 family)
MQTTSSTIDRDVLARNTIPVLNRLISICKDGYYGFRTAANDVRTPACRTLFLTYAEQRAAFASELQDAVRALGAEPETEGSITGLLHREWIDLKARITERNMSSIVEECERGEDTAVKAYAEAMRFALGDEVIPIVQRHYASIKAAHDNIRTLRASRRSA